MKKHLPVFLFLFMHVLVSAQPPNLPRMSAGFPINYSEDSVSNYVLPDPLTMNNGQKVADAKTWTQKRRPELVKLVGEIQFGKMPPRPAHMHFNVFDKGTPVFNGKAVRKQVTVYFTKDTNDHKMDLLIYLPANTRKAVPLLLNISFAVNNQLTEDPGVKIGNIWTREGQKIKADGPSRFSKMNIEQFVDAGIGFACVYYGDIEPDFKDGIKYG